jgi:hypothetical protein
VRILVPLALLLLAGCVAPAHAPAPAAPERTSLPWEIRDCFFVYAQPPAKADVVAAWLPPGFTLAKAAGGRQLVGFEANLCATGTGLDGPVQGQTYASVWASVTPPAGMGNASAAHFVNFDVLVQDAPRRALLQSWGTPAHNGTLAKTDTAGGGFRVDLAMEGVGAFTITVPLGFAQAAPSGAFDQWTPGGKGLIYWRTDWAAKTQSTATGTLSVDPSSRYAAWFEGATMPAVVTFGTWDYTNGVIQRPPAP